jgi:sucrose-6-phosphate hydrolase SacC (GH32 family)
MIYRPVASRKLWDSWLFPWEGRYHLFHLESQQCCHDYIGQAVSEDLVHWQACPSIAIKRSDREWHPLGALTGMVIRHAGQFVMFLGKFSGDRVGQRRSWCVSIQSADCRCVTFLALPC